jgi:acyl-coenzyme A thioesterase PaaI-like protein
MSSSKQGFYSRIKLSPGAFRILMNCWPPFWGLRIHIMQIAPDWRDVKIRMKLSLRNKNFVGSHFGGGMFAMTDPFYMIMLMHLLGDEYLVWDSAATIKFVAPGRGTVFAHFTISDAQLAELRARTASGEKYEPVFHVDVVDETGGIVAQIDKTIYVRKKTKRVAANRDQTVS